MLPLVGKKYDGIKENAKKALPDQNKNKNKKTKKQYQQEQKAANRWLVNKMCSTCF